MECFGNVVEALASQLSSEIDQPVDPGDAASCEGCSSSCDENSGSTFGCEAGVAGRRGGCPEDRADDDHENRYDQNDGQHGANDDLEVADTSEAVKVRKDVHHAPQLVQPEGPVVASGRSAAL